MSPVLLTPANGSGSQIAAVNATNYTSNGGFSTVSSGGLGADSRTRVALWASGISTGLTNINTSNDIFMGNGKMLANFADLVNVEARTSDGRIFNLPVEFVGSLIPGLDQVNIVLIPELAGAGSVELTIVVAGHRSNSGSIVVQ